MENLTDPQKLLMLMRGRNQALEQVLSVSRDFLNTDPMDIENRLPLFERRRERAVQKFSFIDQKITTAAESILNSESPNIPREELKQLIQIGDVTLREIIQIDHEIEKKIGRHTHSLQNRLHADRLAQERSNRFKSTWISGTGEALDRKL